GRPPKPSLRLRFRTATTTLLTMPSPTPPQISPHELAQRLDRGEPLQLLDIRASERVAQGAVSFGPTLDFRAVPASQMYARPRLGGGSPTSSIPTTRARPTTGVKAVSPTNRSRPVTPSPSAAPRCAWSTCPDTRWAVSRSWWTTHSPLPGTFSSCSRSAGRTWADRRKRGRGSNGTVSPACGQRGREI